MNRITPEEVVAAYKELGWKAIDSFYKKDYIPSGTGWEKGICGCGIGVIMAKLGIDSDQGPCVEQLVARRSLSVDYVSGFIRGFDQCPTVVIMPATYATGVKDGAAARQAAREAGLWAGLWA